MDDLSNTAVIEPVASETVSETLEKVETPEAKGPQEVKIIDEKTQDARDEAKLDADLRKVFREAKREREDDGKFKEGKPKEQEAAKALKEQPAADPVKDAPKDDAKLEDKKTETALTKSIDAPAHWPDAVKAKFASLPADVAKEIADAGLKDRQSLTKLGNAVKEYEPVGKVLQEFRETFETKGLSYDAGMRQLLEAQKILDRDPAAGIRKLAQAYKVDLWDTAIQGDSIDPQTTELHSELQETKRQLAALTARLEARETSENNAKANEHLTTVQKFMADKPDFELLEPQISKLLPIIRQSNPGASNADLLEQAYDQAAWANPQTRQQRMDATAKTNEQKRSEAAKKAADDATRARSINVTGSPHAADPDDYDSDMRRIFRKNQAA